MFSLHLNIFLHEKWLHKKGLYLIIGNGLFVIVDPQALETQIPKYSTQEALLMESVNSLILNINMAFPEERRQALATVVCDDFQ